MRLSVKNDRLILRLTTAEAAHIIPASIDKPRISASIEMNGKGIVVRYVGVDKENGYALQGMSAMKNERFANITVAKIGLAETAQAVKAGFELEPVELHTTMIDGAIVGELTKPFLDRDVAFPRTPLSGVINHIKSRRSGNNKPFITFTFNNGVKTINGIAFGRAASFISSYSNGDKVRVIGQIEPSQWLDKDGNQVHGERILVTWVTPKSKSQQAVEQKELADA